MESIKQIQHNDTSCLSLFDESHKLRADEYSISRLYNLYLEKNVDIPIDFDYMSTKTANALRRNGIFSLKQLLDSTTTSIRSFRQVGMKSLEEIDIYLRTIPKDNEGICTLGNKISRSEALFLNKSQILSGNREMITSEHLTELTEETVNLIHNKYELIDNELIHFCETNTEAVKEVVEALEGFVKQTIVFARIQKAMKAIPQFKTKNAFLVYLQLYAREKRVDISSLNINPDYTVLDFSLLMEENDNKEILIDVLEWLSYDLNSDFDNVLDSIRNKDQRRIDVLELRANNETLQNIGDKIGVSRERIRQIENKGKLQFKTWFRSFDFINRLSADLNGKKLITIDDLLPLFHDKSSLLIYFLSFCENKHFSLLSDQALILYEKSVVEETARYIDSLPDVFIHNDFNYFIMCAINQNIPEDLLMDFFNSKYHKGVSVYFREGIAKQRKYEYIMHEFFPKGMHVYDEKELGVFRDYCSKVFGDIELPSDRALGVAISRLCVLCGRGRYVLKREKYISDELVNAISNYIDNSEKSFFLIVSIFKAFEEDLEQFGIDNHYYLHGILRELFEDKYYFSRDYLSKDSKSLSLYAEIEKFVKKTGYPVSKQQIREAYPGITEIMISFAVSDEKILNFDGTYVHVDNLKLYDSDIAYFKQVLSKVICDDVPKHSRVLFDYIMSATPDILKRLSVYYQFSLFSLLEYLFNNEYEFSRPYIANKGIIIDRPKELLEEYVASNDVVDVNELFEMVNDYHASVVDKLKYLLSFNESHLLVSKDQLVSLGSIGITENDVSRMEEKILEELDGTIRIANLNCISKFPKFSVPWNEWLIYSAIYKWGRLTEVGTTSHQFRCANPVIAAKGKLSLEDLKEDVLTNEIGRVDDIDDFDAIADIVIDDIDW